MYLFKRGLPPNYFRNSFTRASQIHSHHISNSSRFSQKGDKRVHTNTRNVALKPMASPSCCHIIPPRPSFHIRLRAVSLFSWSVEQNARDTQMTTRVTEDARRERHDSAALVSRFSRFNAHARVHSSY